MKSSFTISNNFKNNFTHVCVCLYVYIYMKPLPISRSYKVIRHKAADPRNVQQYITQDIGVKHKSNKNYIHKGKYNGGDTQKNSRVHE